MVLKLLCMSWLCFASGNNVSVGLGLGLAQEKGYAMRILGIVMLLLVILTVRCW